MSNETARFKTTIYGVGVHFVHVRSPHADALPLVMTHRTLSGIKRDPSPLPSGEVKDPIPFLSPRERGRS
jgi:hypothetical protein